MSFIIPATRAVPRHLGGGAAGRGGIGAGRARGDAGGGARRVWLQAVVPAATSRARWSWSAPCPPFPAATGGCTGGDPPWAVERGRIKNVYVRISSPVALRRGGGFVLVSRQGCAFSPRVVAATLGQSLELTGDGLSPVVQVFSGLELVFTGVTAVARWTPPGEGLFRLQAGPRGGTTGYVSVSPHPFAAVSDSAGKFRLSNVPPGHHTITAWHELGGERTAEVMVVAGRTAEVRFSYEGERPFLTAAAPVVSEPRPAPTEPPPVAAPAAAPAVEPPVNDHRCHIATGASLIGQACKAGGLSQARATMKELVVVARRRGARVECASCHVDDTSFTLQPVARERLEQLLGFVTAVPVIPALSRRWRDGGTDPVRRC